jgi:peptidoglycan/xylan/chitin deacetylase (PgdA/CDA1 family)
MAALAMGAILLLFNVFAVGVNNSVAQAATPKYVMLHFDDGYQSIYNNAKPILDKYHIKTTQYIVCGNIGKSTLYMTWNQVDTLIKGDHSIQAHTMTHPHLPTLSDSQLDYQLKQCKSILGQHGADVTTFAIPFDDGEDNERVVKAISKYYESAKGRGGAPFPVNCGGNCKVYNIDGSFNVKSRYAINQWSHDSYSETHNTENEIYQGFVNAVNTGQVDTQGNLVKVPIIVYHRVGEGGYSVSKSLLDREMKYLKDNGFTTLTMDDIEYNPTTNRFQLNN